MNLIRQYLNSFQSFSQNIAFQSGEKSLTYREFLKLVNGSRLLLEKQGFKIQEPVGVLCDESAETYAAVFAIWFSGGIFIPLNQEYPKKAKDEILKKHNIRYVFCPGNCPDKNKFLKGINIIDNDNFWSDSLLPLHEWKESETLYILTTSGSSGTPKTVPVSLKNITAYIDGFLERYPELNEKDSFLQTYDLTADAAFTGYLIPFLLGAKVYTVPRGQFKPFAVAKMLRDVPVTFVKVTPSLLACLYPFFSSFNLPGIRHFHFGGEALPADMVEQWRLRMPNAEISNGYGPTETTVTATIFKCRPGEKLKEKNNIVSIGKPLKNVEVIIHKKTGQEIGELCISGNQVMENYLFEKEQPFKIFSHRGILTRFYSTGDQVQQDEDGFLYFLGRTDDQVKIHGYRIDLVEIENHVREIVAGSKNIAAVAVDKAPGVNQLVVFIENYTESGDDVIREMRSRLPHFKIPERIIGVERFPLSVSGKTDKKALVSQFNLTEK